MAEGGEKLSRIPRRYSFTDVYHVILKGIDSQNIFYDDQDRRCFLKYIAKTQENFNFILYVYCLMDNHVHMVIKSKKEFLSKSMQSLAIKYAHFFNKKYNRTGPLFQNRFRSKSVEDPRYFLEVCRYVHRNPENSGIAKTEKYEWSSYQEYLGKKKLIDSTLLLECFKNNIADFIKYTTKSDSSEYLNDLADYEIIDKLTDSQVEDIISKIFHFNDVSEIPYFFKNQNGDLLKKSIIDLKKIKGTNKTQISRIIRQPRQIIEKIWNE